MFEKFVRFFIENSRLNYTLFFLICAIGVWSYNKTPKEIFPLLNWTLCALAALTRERPLTF